MALHSEVTVALPAAAGWGGGNAPVGICRKLVFVTGRCEDEHLKWQLIAAGVTSSLSSFLKGAIWGHWMLKKKKLYMHDVGGLKEKKPWKRQRSLKMGLCMYVSSRRLQGQIQAGKSKLAAGPTRAVPAPAPAGSGALLCGVRGVLWWIQRVRVDRTPDLMLFNGSQGNIERRQESFQSSEARWCDPEQSSTWCPGHCTRRTPSPRSTKKSTGSARACWIMSRSTSRKGKQFFFLLLFSCHCYVVNRL